MHRQMHPKSFGDSGDLDFVELDLTEPVAEDENDFIHLFRASLAWHASHLRGYKLVAVWSNCDVLQLKGQLFRRPMRHVGVDRRKGSC